MEVVQRRSVRLWDAARREWDGSGGGEGLIQAALLEFTSAAAGAGFIPADLGFFAAVGNREPLCIFVHGGRGLHSGNGIEIQHGFEGCRRLLQNGEGGFKAHGRRCLGVGENLANGVDGSCGEHVDLISYEQGAVVQGVGEGRAEDLRGAAPVGDGVAMNAGLCGGIGDGRTIGKGGDHLILKGGKHKG